MENESALPSHLTIPEILNFFKTRSINTNLCIPSIFEDCVSLFQPGQNHHTIEEKQKTVALALQEFQFSNNPMSQLLKQEKSLKGLSKLFEYQIFQAGKKLIDIGETTNKLYLIIKGEAIVYIPVASDLSTRGDSVIQNITTIPSITCLKSDADVSGSRNDLNESMRKSSRSHRMSLENPPKTSWELSRELDLVLRHKGSQNQLEQEYKSMLLEFKFLEKIAEGSNRYLNNGYFVYKPISRLSAGQYFGEVDQTINKPSQRMIFASQDIHCLVLTQNNYQDILTKSVGGYNTNFRFLQGFFPKAASLPLTSLVYSMETQTFHLNQVIFEQEEEPKAMYFIQEGEVQLTKKTGEKSKVFFLNNKKVISNLGKNKKYVITTLGKGEILGEDELFFDKAREYTATVISRDATLLRLDKVMFKSLSETYNGLFDNIKEMCRLKKFVRKKQEISSRDLAEAINNNAPLTETEEKQCNALDPLYKRLAKWIHKRPEEAKQKHFKAPVTKDDTLRDINESPRIKGSKFMKMLSQRKLEVGSKEFLKTSYFKDEESSNEKSRTKGDRSPGQSRSPPSHQNKNEISAVQQVQSKVLDSDWSRQQSRERSIRDFVPSYQRIPHELSHFSPFSSPRNKAKKEDKDLSFAKIDYYYSLGPDSFMVTTPPVIHPLELPSHNDIDDFLLAPQESNALRQSQSPKTRKASQQPKTTGGYYLNSKRVVVTPKRALPTPALVSNSVYMKLSEMKESQKKEDNQQKQREDSLNSSRTTMYNSMVKSPNLNSQVRLSHGPRRREHSNEKSTKQPENFHVNKTLDEYFPGFGEKKLVSPKRTMISSAHSMFRLNTNKAHLQQKYRALCLSPKPHEESSLYEGSLSISKLKPGSEELMGNIIKKRK